MKSITKWIIAVVVANILLLPATFGGSKETRAAPQNRSFLYDCCRKTSTAQSHCCEKCCWRPASCSDCIGAARN